MRRRPASDPRTADVARRRLEALSRELGLETSEAPQPSGTADARGHDPVGGVAPPLPLGPPDAAPRGGRHVAPRLSRGERLGLRLAERGTPDGRGFGSAHLALVAVLVAGSLALGAWHTLRGSTGPEEAPVSAPTLVAPDGDAAEPVGETSAPTATATDAADAAAEGSAGAAGAVTGPEIVVDVVGRVRRPGIAVLPSGSRVVDALEAAGGARRGVGTDSLNLARPLVDGEQIVVGRVAAVAAPAAPTPTTGSTAGSTAPTAPALVNLNTADQATLETLPGVGPVTAQAILQWRAEHGGFTAVEELLDVSGIGDATLAEIAPFCTL